VTGTVVRGNVPLEARTANVGPTQELEFFVDGKLVGRLRQAPWRISWNSHTHLAGKAVVTVRLVDFAGLTIIGAGSLTSVLQVANANHTRLHALRAMGPHGRLHVVHQRRLHVKRFRHTRIASFYLAASTLDQQEGPVPPNSSQSAAVLVPVSAPVNRPWSPAGSIIAIALLALGVLRVFERRLSRLSRTRRPSPP
jgi:hypothetical protein